ncbi:MAG TPA: sigma factor-like helix-turn-helix DNA-binding protein [Atribacterota bacterium]|nr:sigma factor-like helix-turn-helix DNA-binding protein [Atribacterota bacterium]
MLKTREILRLRHELGLSLREIGQVCSCGETTVSEILTRAKDAEIVWSIDLMRIPEYPDGNSEGIRILRNTQME